MDSFVDVCYRYRFWIYSLGGICTLWFGYTLWNGTNLFLDAKILFGIAIGLSMWALERIINKVSSKK